MITTRLEELLSQRDRTLYWLSKETGVGYKTLHKLARGRADSIKFDILDKICSLLDCAPGDVLVQVPEVKSKRRG
ncbi:MAG: helix-turn-helix domain-containing protein [Acidobacteriota bacterium]